MSEKILNDAAVSAVSGGITDKPRTRDIDNGMQKWELEPEEADKARESAKMESSTFIRESAPELAEAILPGSAIMNGTGSNRESIIDQLRNGN